MDKKEITNARNNLRKYRTDIFKRDFAVSWHNLIERLLDIAESSLVSEDEWASTDEGLRCTQCGKLKNDN